jgi:O-antigen ligase
MVELIYTKDFYNEKAPDHLKEFASFYNTWKMNKYIGGGIKNFWYYCAVEQTLRKNSLTVCNTHPHNYYLEIITETGLLGLIVFLAILIQILLITFYKKYFTNSSLQNNNVLIPFIFLFLCEIFPLKSTGSIFTTNNATYLFLLISILIGISNQEKLIENKK